MILVGLLMNINDICNESQPMEYLQVFIVNFTENFQYRIVEEYRIQILFYVKFST